jgi:probable rRNA maturation factor
MTSDPAPSTTGTATIAVAIEADGWSGALPDPEALVAEAAFAALSAACPDLGPATISLLLADDQAVSALNRDWRGKDGPTNVLSFPATETRAGEIPEPEFDGVPLELGDIALAFETCQREATAQLKTLADHTRHLTVHGVLHLLGYDHVVEAEAEQMEALETRILAGLGVADPYAAEKLGDD